MSLDKLNIFLKNIHQRTTNEGAVDKMKNYRTRRPFSLSLITLIVPVIFFLFIASSLAGPPASKDLEKVSGDLINAYRQGVSGFWTAFGDNKEKIDGPVLGKTLDHAIAERDDTLVNLVLEGARIKGDQSSLVSIMLISADYFLSVSLHAEALKLYDEAMPLARSTDDPALLAKSYEGNGDIAFYTGNTTNAILMYNKAAELYARAASAIGQGVVARKMGDVFTQTGANEQAKAFFERALSLLPRRRDNLEEGNVYRGLGNLFMRQRDYKAATGFFEIALTRYFAARYKNGEADIYRALGETALRTGDNKKAGGNYEKALAIYNGTRSLIGQGYANKGLADINYFSGKNDEALTLYDKALGLFVTAGYPLGQADVLRRMGQINLRTGHIQKVAEIYEKALPIYRQVKEPVGQADVYKGIGDIGYYNRNFSRALEMYDKALPYYVHANEPIGQGNVNRAIGDIYFYAGNDLKAMEYYEKALTFYIKANSPLGQANTYRTMGETYLRLKKNDHATAMFNSAMALYKRTDEPIGQGDIYKTFGEIYLQKGNKMAALNMFQEALKYLERAHSIVDQGHAYQGIGDVFMLAGDHVKSIENYDRALALYGQMEDKESEAFVLMKKASVFGQKADIRAAIKLFEEGLGKFEQVRTQAMFSDIKKSYMEKVYDYYEDAAVFMLNNKESEKAFYYIEAMKARVFLDQLAEARVDLEKGIDPATKKERDALEGELFVIGKKLAGESQKETPDKEVIEKLKQEHSLAQEKLDTLRRDIRYKNPLYASIQYPQPLTVKSLQEKVLRDGELLAEYFLTKQGVFCLIVSNTDFTIIGLPVMQEDLVKKIGGLLRNIQGFPQGERFRGNLAEELYDILVKPLEPFLAGRTLIVVPQGILAYLPFEVLRTEHDGKKIFMTEKYRVKYIQSATVLGVLRSQYEQEGSNDNFIGFGDPVYDYQGFKSGTEEGKDKDRGAPGITPGAAFTKSNYLRAGGTLTRLTGSGEEIEGIKKIFEKKDMVARSFLRIDAREENAKSQEIEQYSFIHFSTHGIVEPQFQAIALSQIPDEKEDGFLTLGEIMNSRFNARLVVLSACETGLGDMTRGEGVTGLTRAVMYAGSPAALVSLWNVSDEGARELMIIFYENLIDKKMSKEEALRAAKAKLISGGKEGTFSHPFFWSAFVMYGE